MKISRKHSCNLRWFVSFQGYEQAYKEAFALKMHWQLSWSRCGLNPAKLTLLSTVWTARLIFIQWLIREFWKQRFINLPDKPAYGWNKVGKPTLSSPIPSFLRGLTTLRAKRMSRSDNFHMRFCTSCPEGFLLYRKFGGISYTIKKVCFRSRLFYLSLDIIE